VTHRFTGITLNRNFDFVAALVQGLTWRLGDYRHAAVVPRRLKSVAASVMENSQDFQAKRQASA